MLFCLEDLDKVGYTKRYKNRCNFNLDQAKICITWLAEFHAKFMNSKQSISDLVTQNKIWSWGTYWNLDQRLDLLQKLALSQENSLTEAATNLEVDLKNKARKLHEKLQNAKFKTIIHGDAKVENFCFYHDMTKVAGVDFQYVGTGIGVTDFWYFLTSCLENIETKHAKLLDFYFSELRKNLTTWSAENLDQMEAEWRELYPFCIADFERFVRANWPGHWKLTDFTFQTCQKALDQL